MSVNLKVTCGSVPTLGTVTNRLYIVNPMPADGFMNTTLSRRLNPLHKQLFTSTYNEKFRNYQDGVGTCIVTETPTELVAHLIIKNRYWSDANLEAIKDAFDHFVGIFQEFPILKQAKWVSPMIECEFGQIKKENLVPLIKEVADECEIENWEIFTL